MDLDSLDSIGLQPLKDLLQRFGGWPVIDDSWTEENFKWQVSKFWVRCILCTCAQTISA